MQLQTAQTMETPAPESQLPKDELVQMVGFKIGKELFGVHILSVQEIIRKAPITAVPDSPDFIEGVINLRGNIIPVIDLRKRMRSERGSDPTSGNWIIILNIQQRITGFIVDEVTKVLKVPKNSVSHPPDILNAGLKSRYIQGVVKMEIGLLILLDFNRILMVDEIKKLKDVNNN